MVFYSAKTRGFYHLDLHGQNMPDDVVEISEEYHQTLMSGQHLKEIVPDENGYPILVDIKPRELTWEERRKKAYPKVEEQLDMIFHGRIDEWKEKIQAVKDSIPKE
jgi:hypothetical protein